MALITVKDLALAYEGHVVAGDISFEVNSGDYLCIVGENGSGKTTLMKALLGLMKIHAGSITFGDGLTQTQIGYMPQRTDIQKDFPASCKEVVLSGTLGNGKFHPFYTKEEKQRAQKNIALLGIEELQNKDVISIENGCKIGYVTDVEPGHGLMRVSGAVIPFDCTIPQDTELYRLMNTTPGRR